MLKITSSTYVLSLLFSEMSRHVFCPFSNWMVCVFIAENPLCILDMRPLSIRFTISYSEAYIFILWRGSFAEQKFLILKKFNQWILFFQNVLDVMSKNSSSSPKCQMLSPLFSYKSVISYVSHGSSWYMLSWILYNQCGLPFPSPGLLHYSSFNSQVPITGSNPNAPQ